MSNITNQSKETSRPFHEYRTISRNYKTHFITRPRTTSIGWYKIRIFHINKHKQPLSGQSVEIITRHFGINDTNCAHCGTIICANGPVN